MTVDNVDKFFQNKVIPLYPFDMLIVLFTVLSIGYSGSTGYIERPKVIDNCP